MGKSFGSSWYTHDREPPKLNAYARKRESIGISDSRHEFLSTSYLDLHPLNCVLPGSPVFTPILTMVASLFCMITF